MIRSRRHQRGFTMVELMISLVISSLLVGMILSIFTRMSTAYRTQQHVAELQQVLTAAQDLIQRDVRQAGFAMPDGFRVAGAVGVYPAVEIRDNQSGFGPDELHVFYADSSAQARVLTFDSIDPDDTFTTFTVDNPDRFQQGDLAVISNYTLVTVGAFNILTARYEACVVQITGIAGTTFTVATTGNWGSANNDQCDFVRPDHTGTTTTMVYRFVAHGYRIDSTRRNLAVLQQSPSGGLIANDWQDLGIGFIDLQLASRWYEEEDDDTSIVPMRRQFDTPDPDTDALRDWYSGAEQNVLSAFQNPAVSTRPLLMELRVSIAVRTTAKLDIVGTGATPSFTDNTRPLNNDLGNRASVTLAGVADAARPIELRGDAIIRYSTVGSDTRNLSVGR